MDRRGSIRVVGAAVTLVLAATLTACGGSDGSGGGSGGSGTTPASTAPPASTLPPTTTPATTPTTAAPLPSFGSGNTPEEAIAAYLRTLRGAPGYAGDCAATELPRDIGTWCSALRSPPTDSRTYIIGPVSAGAAEVLTVERRGTEWAVTAHTEAPQPG